MSGLKVMTLECELPKVLGDLAEGSLEEAYQVPEGKRFRKSLYVKAHKGDENIAQTLFVANVGACWDQEDLEGIFKRFGKVNKVDLGKVQGCNFARVKFENPKSLKRALAKTGTEECIEFTLASEDPFNERGKKKPRWLDEYESNRPGTKLLQEECDNFMQAFARAEQEESKRREELAKEQDDDGFTTVSYRKSSKSKYAAPLAKDVIATGNQQQFLATVTGSSKNLMKNSKKKKKGFEDFYRFQTREKKRDELAELREKFAQDKAHLERLKSSKAFKPF